MELQVFRVPRTGIEPALAFKYQLDFKSNASTYSATEAKADKTGCRIKFEIVNIRYYRMILQRRILFLFNANYSLIYFQQILLKVQSLSLTVQTVRSSERN